MYLSSFIDKKYKKVIVISILITGIIQVIYAICQIYEVEGIYRMVRSTGKIIFLSNGFKIDTEIWATGFVTNPNFFCTYMLLCISYSIGLYIDEKTKIKCILLIIISALFFVGILISNTMSGVVGLFVVLLYTLVYCIKNKCIKKIAILLIAGVIILVGVTKIGKTKLIKDVNITGKQATEIAKGNLDDKFGTKRIYIWKKTVKIVPKNLIHGVGIDNFYYAFNGKPLISPDKKTFYDKAHNEYLQILITHGILCTATYILMYASIGIKGIKNSYKNKQIYIILPVIGYLIQAFFNISVIEVAPLFYITLGLCIDNNKVTSSKIVKQKK